MVISFLVAFGLGQAASDFVTPLTEKQIEKARTAIAAMREAPRGPYNGIIWFCNDGTQQPPRLNGCAEHGGGVMYALHGPEAQKLASWGLYVGTILTAFEPEQIPAAGWYLPRALVVERYLERALDGWVLHYGRTFRGFRQDEDEAEAARGILIQMVSERMFLEQHRALVIRLSKAVPYGRVETQAGEIRALAAVIGDADPKMFGNLRFKIHALPEPADIGPVEAYAAASTTTADLVQKARELAAKMRAFYDPAARQARMKEVSRWVQDKATRQAMEAFVATNPQDTPGLLTNGFALMQAADKAIRIGSPVPERNLLLLHVMGLVEELWLALAADLSRRPLSRAEAVATLSTFVQSARYVGLLSARELGMAQENLKNVASGSGKLYIENIVRLGRVLEWGRARVQADLGVALTRYEAVEPQASQVVDDVLRSGVLLPFAVLLDRMAQDAERLKGADHKLLGLSGSVTTVRGENPGLALGKLRVIAAGGSLEGAGRNDILLLNDLPPELPPVAGVLTVGAVGSLSHVALLARNLGIPLATVGTELASALAKINGQEIVLGVSQGRRVVMGPASKLTPEELARVKGDAPKAVTSLTIDAARLDLKLTRILPLSEVSETDAGVRVGPKAAELGRLKRLFPERVSDAAVIPFGVFLRHVDSPLSPGSPTPLSTLRDAYKRYQVDVKADAAKADADVLQALENFRGAIAALPFAPGFEAEVLAALKRLGPPGTFGVFVRSDTNVEDLKDFTGAGLNLTVSNKVVVKEILASIRDVWASPFSERSFRWRQRLLTNPEHVYPSVILHRTVPSEMSGVIVTCDIESGEPGAVTVSAGEGVSAVVDGGAPETLVLMGESTPRLLTSSRSTTRKIIPYPPGQGVRIDVTRGLDPLLGDKEIAELRGLAGEVLAKIPPKQGAPWDIEWGIVKGKAYLMQLRPLKLARAAAVHPFLAPIDANARPVPASVDLTQPLP